MCETNFNPREVIVLKSCWLQKMLHNRKKKHIMGPTFQKVVSFKAKASSFKKVGSWLLNLLLLEMHTRAALTMIPLCKDHLPLISHYLSSRLLVFVSSALSF